MCCQTTPAIGIDPMKPITTMRLRFIIYRRGRRGLTIKNSSHRTQ
jgi:hypothetical protein